MMAMFAMFSMAQPQVMQQDMFAGMQPDDKAVVVAVHYGSVDADVRRDAIEKFNLRLQNEFPDCYFREAWTSRSAIKTLDQLGEVRLSPVRLMRELELLGYTHVLIQPSELTDGQEMQHLRSEVQAARNRFKCIRLGEPLLTTVKDYEMTILATAASCGKEKIGNVLVCYPSKGYLDTHYTMLDYMLRDMGMDNWYVTTVGGYPDIQSLMRELKARKDKRVNLIPCVFAGGQNVADDILGNIKVQLEQAGIKVEVTMHSIGESDEVIDRYIEHARYARQYRTLTPTEMKLIENAQ